MKDAFEVGGFVPLFIRPLFCEGKGPFRWAVLSGDPKDLHVTDEEILKLFPDDEPLHPGTGVTRRHADAGYEKAIQVAMERGVDLPMVTNPQSE